MANWNIVTKNRKKPGKTMIRGQRERVRDGERGGENMRREEANYISLDR